MTRATATWSAANAWFSLLQGWIGHTAALLVLGYYQQGFRDVLDTVFNTPLMWLVHATQSPGMDRAMIVASIPGRGAFVTAAFILLLACAWRWRGPVAVRRVAWIMLGTAIFTGVGKGIVEAARPQLWASLESVSGPTFPSSHASASFALALAIASLMPARWRLTTVLAITMAALTGFSRVYLGVHRPTDILLTWLCVLSWSIWVYSRLPRD